jgi:hypothetical protein
LAGPSFRGLEGILFFYFFPIGILKFKRKETNERSRRKEVSFTRNFVGGGKGAQD